TPATPATAGAGSWSNPGSPGIEGEAGAACAGARQVDGAPSAPGPDGDAAPAAGGPGVQPLQFALTVPFPSPMEAEIAYRYLTPNAELQGPVRKELNVNGNILTVPGRLQISITSCLDQVSLVIRTMQRIVPPFSFKPQQDKGG
uniref:Cancer/testis antigen 1-like n=1 Tax=Neovison vison TaxID=452646 RepID=A0A8C7B5U5_NEOVI